MTKPLRGENARYRHYQRRARDRNIIFRLTKKQFRELTQFECYYCGAKPNHQYKRRGAYSAYVGNGIDRIDNKKGYTLGNCIPCCPKCNKMKGILPCDEFVTQVKRIASHKKLKLHKKLKETKT